MKVEQIINELLKFPKDMEVFTKKIEVFGNIGCTFSIKQDEYSMFGILSPCVIISDIAEEDE